MFRSAFNFAFISFHLVYGGVERICAERRGHTSIVNQEKRFTKMSHFNAIDEWRTHDYS